MSIFRGSNAAETLSGSTGDDFIYGYAGDDRILTYDGADRAEAGDGNDEINGYKTGILSYTYWSFAGPKTILAGIGDDFVYGGTGNDSLYGEDGNDELHGGEGNDGLEGGAGNDDLFGLSGDDTLAGGAGDDSLNGGDGHDALDAGDGNDSLNAGAGADTLSGGEGHDVLYSRTSDMATSFDDGGNVMLGGSGDDTLFGGNGSDTIDGGTGVDELYGDAGDDTYHIRSATRYVYDTGGSDTAYVHASFVKLPSSIENVVYQDGAQPLPYWISALLPDAAAGLRYASLLGASQQFGYSFPLTVPAHYASDAEDTAGWTPFTTVQQTQVESALSYISIIAGLHFVKTSDASGLNTITFANNSQLASAGYARTPDDTALGSDLFLDNSDALDNATISDGTYAAYTLIHELGHAVGLKHPFLAADSSGHAADPPYLPSTEDRATWTVMSYASSSSEYHLRLSPLDIAALQYLYGPSKTARVGDDTYAVSSVSANFVWDGAGTDTITAAACEQGCTVYLTPGHWGQVGEIKAPNITAAGQITVNFGTTIENLTGSAFADHLYGNEVGNLIDAGGGNDWLEGGAGNDTLLGGAGQDTARYAQNAASHVLTLRPSGILVSDPNGQEGADVLGAIEQLAFARTPMARKAQMCSVQSNNWRLQTGP